MGLEPMAAATAATQWLERTLDDSASRRLVLPQAFLAIDALLLVYQNVAEGLAVYPQVIAKNLEAELPFMATENILMAAVKAGGNRQELHRKIRLHSQAAAAQVKKFGKPNDLIARLKADIDFSKIDFDKVLNPKHYVGRAPQQVNEFIKDIVAPIQRKYRKELSRKVELNV